MRMAAPAAVTAREAVERGIEAAEKGTEAAAREVQGEAGKLVVAVDAARPVSATGEAGHAAPGASKVLDAAAARAVPAVPARALRPPPDLETTKSRSAITTKITKLSFKESSCPSCVAEGPSWSSE